MGSPRESGYSPWSDGEYMGIDGSTQGAPIAREITVLLSSVVEKFRRRH